MDQQKHLNGKEIRVLLLPLPLFIRSCHESTLLTILRTCKIYPLSGFRSCSNRKYTVIVVHIITLKITLSEERFLASPASFVLLSFSFSLCSPYNASVCVCVSAYLFRFFAFFFFFFCFECVHCCVLLKMLCYFRSLFPPCIIRIVCIRQ